MPLTAAPPPPAAIAHACEAVCARLGMGVDVQRVIAFAVQAIHRPPLIEGLTTQQSAILRALKNAEGRTVSTDVLMHVAGARGRRSIKVQICHIRRLYSQIENEPGVGYRWVGE